MEIKKNISLKNYTTFKIGGYAKFFAAVKSIEDATQAYLFAKKNMLKTFVLGKGSNILFDDSGFSGLVIYNDIDFLDINENSVNVGAGFSFIRLGLVTASKNLSGLEFAAGVPGSVGGAVFMNASTYDQKISNTIEEVTYLDEDGNIYIYKKDEMDFKYRHSIFQKKKGIIISAKFLLTSDENAKQRQLEIVTKKRSNQPMNERNAGCIFKNPENISAKILISECGLVNYKIGKAKVSEKHPNFIINENDASSKDVLLLISHIKKTVFDKTKIKLQEEVRYITNQ
ncbi:MAG: UDP-N-acetylmuramate dehydrogenase [Parachlamydiales bacterium]|nr:UDP-N-acetylmuramate dehydrogenase [Parachlamydiales bacterium]